MSPFLIVRLECDYILFENLVMLRFLYKLFEIFKGDSLVRLTQAGLPTDNDIGCELQLYAMYT